MSTPNYRVYFLFLLIICATAVSAGAQTGRLEVSVAIGLNGKCTVRGEIITAETSAQKSLSFVDFYADAENLGSRVNNVEVFDSKGNSIALRKFNDAEYVAGSPYSAFSYEINLGQPKPLIAAPHMSWTDGRRTLLKMQDLLPQLAIRPARIDFELNADLTIATAEKDIGKNSFEVEEVDDAVFLISREQRPLFRQIGSTRIEMTLTDDWQFEDKLAIEMALEIVEEYRNLFGFIPEDRIQINLLKFPPPMDNDRWRAETQRNTITIVSSETTYKNLAPQRLHEQLRHEIFHLWIPEALELSGDYAWFYEGFARYQSLKTGVWIGRLTFDDFLESMSEAINIAGFDTSGLPLFELSKQQWVSGPGILAAKGMSVAFLCDVLLLNERGGKQSIAVVLEELFRKHGSTEVSTDALTAIESVFSNHKSINGVIEKYVKNTAEIDWLEVLAPFDIAVNKRGGRYTLSVAEKPKGKAKALLNKLGYTRWKKFLP